MSQKCLLHVTGVELKESQGNPKEPSKEGSLSGAAD